MRLRGAGRADNGLRRRPWNRCKSQKKLGTDSFFQLPPQLKSSDLKLLEDFLAGMPKEIRAAFEFRHDSWFNDEVFSALRKARMPRSLPGGESENLVTPAGSRLAEFFLSPSPQRKLFA